MLNKKYIALAAIPVALALASAVGLIANADDTTGTSTVVASSTAATSTLSLVSSNISTSTLTEGQSATITATVESQNASTTDAIVEFTVFDPSDKSRATTTFTGQTLSLNQPVIYTATTSPGLLANNYHVWLSIYNNNRTQTLATFPTIGSFVVQTMSTTSGTSTATSTATTTDNTTGTTTSTTTGTTTGTTTASSTDVSSLLARISALELRVSALEQQVLTLGGTIGTTTGTTTGSTTMMMGHISPTNVTVRAGTSVDFNGRGFGIEEPVSVTMNGISMTTAHADGGGNFSTGSLSVPMGTGSQTYMFTGMNSGIMGSATINVTE
jgi:hypothetical protein